MGITVNCSKIANSDCNELKINDLNHKYTFRPVYTDPCQILNDFGMRFCAIT